MRKRCLCALLALCMLLTAMASSAMAASISIRFPVREGIVFVGAKGTLRPETRGLNRGDLRWGSNNNQVVSVRNGSVYARKPGVASIAAYRGQIGAIVTVAVLPRTVTLNAGESVSLPRIGSEVYRSLNGDIAAVSASGVITGRNRGGTTTVQVACGKQVLGIRVTVIPPESRAARLKCADTASQVVLVEYKGGSKATLSVHEKENGKWIELYSCQAYVGKNGMGKTKEGDKKTPVGTFNLTTPFGIKADPGSLMPYLKVTKYHYWCGASSSKYYNQLVDSRVTGRAVTSSDEHLINYTGVYNYCMFIDYNASGQAHKGSCIFLHCTGKNSYTAGCVAIPESAMKKIIQWARPGVKIVLGNPI